jgi:hypothetical protein
MTILTDLPFDVPIEELCQAQGMNMHVIQQRRPELFALTVQAARDAQERIHPIVILGRHKVQQVERTRIRLEGGYELTGRFVAKRLAAAEEVVAVVCTVGSGFERLVSAALADDKTAYAYALDAAGSVALSHVADQVSLILENEAAQAGKQTSSRYGPGIHSWPITVGQPQLFALLPEASNYVELTPSRQMLPLKSASFIVGIGENLVRLGSECDDCDARDTCTFRQHRTDIGPSQAVQPGL